MNGKIDNEGYLWILRGKQGKPQKCPMTSLGVDHSTYNRFCGDWCPLFGEPEPDTDPIFEKNGETTFKPNGKTVLSLCHQTLTFDVLVDDRGE